MTTIQRFVLMPLAMAIVTGALCGGIVWRCLPEMDPVAAGLIITLTVWSVLTGLTTLKDWWLPVVEVKLGVDLNRDGVVGHSAAESDDLPDATVMLVGAQDGGSLALGYWKKQGWSRTRWEKARDALLKGGLIKLRKPGSPSAGYCLSKKGGGTHQVSVFKGGNKTHVEV